MTRSSSRRILGFTRLWVVDVDSERARCLTTGEREVRSFAWTPDSLALVTITTDAPEYDALFGPGDLWQISVEGRLPRHVARFRTTPSSPVIVETSDGLVVAVRAYDHRDQPEDSIWTVRSLWWRAGQCAARSAGNVEELCPFQGPRDALRRESSNGRTRGSTRSTFRAAT